MKYLRNVTTLQFFKEKCTACGKCVEVCPHGVFIIKGEKAALVERDLCIECGACAKNCGFGAIRVNAGVGCATAIINGMLRGTQPNCDCSSPASRSCC